MVTMDSDFLTLAMEGVSHAGIGYANPRRSVGELISALMLVFGVLTPAELANHVEYL
jgi:hypothetical protein